MLSLPKAAEPLLSRFATAFTKPTYQRAMVLFVGFVPAEYSCKLDMPSPSESALAAAPVGLPKYCCSHQSGMPSPSVSMASVVTLIVPELPLVPLLL